MLAPAISVTSGPLDEATPQHLSEALEQFLLEVVHVAEVPVARWCRCDNLFALDPDIHPDVFEILDTYVAGSDVRSRSPLTEVLWADGYMRCNDLAATCYHYLDKLDFHGIPSGIFIYTHPSLQSFDLYHVFALTYRHCYARSLLQLPGSTGQLDLLHEHNSFDLTLVDGPLPLAHNTIKDQLHYVYGLMIDLFNPGCGELYSNFACRTFREAVRTAWSLSVSITQYSNSSKPS